MEEPDKSDKILDDEMELDFDEQDLQAVEISDTTLENDDKQSGAAKKEAKKTAKQLRTPEERARVRKKQLIIGAGAAAVLLLVLLVAPFTRWPILNAVGFRGSVVLTITDTANKPLINAAVRLDNGTLALSDKAGKASFQAAKLGKRTAIIQKSGYGDKSIQFVNSFGTTKKSEQLKTIGIKIDIDIKDWLSGRPLEGATASFEESTALSDNTGRASLVIPPTDKKAVAVSVAAPGYITKTLEADTAVLSKEVALVPAQKNYFISKRDGKFDLFSSNLDGSDQRKVIEATGKEEESLLQLSIHRGNKQAVLVATREGKVQNGRLIAGIYAVDLEKAVLRKIDEGSDIQLYDWSENTLAYAKSESGLTYDDPAFSRLMSFNSASGKLSQVAAANYFEASLVAQNKLFFVPADAYRLIENGVLTSYDLQSGAKKTYLADRQINYIGRSSYAALELQDGSGAAFELQLPNGATKAISRRPAVSLLISLSPNGQLAAWSDRRDGQGALIVRQLKDGSERVAAKAAGLTSPIRFVTDTAVVVRVATSQETADYVVDLPTGKLKKIVDVSNVGNNRQPGL